MYERAYPMIDLSQDTCDFYYIALGRKSKLLKELSSPSSVIFTSAEKEDYHRVNKKRPLL